MLCLVYIPCLVLVLVPGNKAYIYRLNLILPEDGNRVHPPEKLLYIKKRMMDNVQKSVTVLMYHRNMSSHSL
jgi:hypothetical protein